MPKMKAKKPEFEWYVPKCATEEAVVEWLKAADSPNLVPPPSGFCSDCLPDYQARMIEQGRCENPGVQFVWKRTTGVSGVLR